MSNKSDATLILDDTNFTSTILDSDKPAMVDFWGDDCAPCKVIAPVIDELANDYAGRVNIAKVKVEEAPETAASYGVRGVPTVVFIENGEEKTRMMGAALKQKFVDVLEVLAGDDDEAQQELLALNEVRQAIFEDDLAKVQKILNDNPRLITKKFGDSQTIIGTAVLVNRSEILDYLVEAGATTSFSDLAALGHTAEMRIIASNDNSVIDQAGGSGFTPLQLAVLTGQCDSVGLLIELGANVDKSGAGQASITPLVLATGRENLDILKALVEAGADVDASTENGLTSLHGAVLAGSTEIVEYLLTTDISTQAMNAEGDTALALAEKHDHREIVRLLAAKAH